jgi:hypothetical protein
MNLLDNIWSQDGKYASEDSIHCCWRKADILFPPSWMADINNEIGRASPSAKHKKISDQDCDLVCNLMRNLTTKSWESGLDVSSEGFAMQGSFIEEWIAIGDIELQEILEKWVDVKSDKSFQEDIIEEAMDEFDMKNFTEGSAELSNNDPMDEDVNSVMENGKEGPSSASWKLQTILRHYDALANQLVQALKVSIFSVSWNVVFVGSSCLRQDCSPHSLGSLGGLHCVWRVHLLRTKFKRSQAIMGQ